MAAMAAAAAAAAGHRLLLIVWAAAVRHSYGRRGGMSHLPREAADFRRHGLRVGCAQGGLPRPQQRSSSSSSNIRGSSGGNLPQRCVVRQQWWTTRLLLPPPLPPLLLLQCPRALRMYCTARWQLCRGCWRRSRRRQLPQQECVRLRHHPRTPWLQLQNQQRTLQLQGSSRGRCSSSRGRREEPDQQSPPPLHLQRHRSARRRSSRSRSSRSSRSRSSSSSSRL